VDGAGAAHAGRDRRRHRRGDGRAREASAWLAADEGRAERERERREQELIDVLDEEVARRVHRNMEAEASDGRAGLIEKVRAGTMDPYTAALTILDDAAAVDRLTRR
jgi:putative protein kinase ArgK-like GTPase of G3E family